MKNLTIAAVFIVLGLMFASNSVAKNIMHYCQVPSCWGSSSPPAGVVWDGYEKRPQNSRCSDSLMQTYLNGHMAVMCAKPTCWDKGLPPKGVIWNGKTSNKGC